MKEKVKSEISPKQFFNKNRRGLTTIASTLIIVGLVIAIGIVFIIIYNIISSEIEYSTESNISLQIEKSSVVIDENNKVSLKVSRDSGNSELEKIKFVLFDGENIEEIEKKASDFEESTERSFSFTPKLVINIKTISVVPIIKVAGKRKYLAVANSIQITKPESGNINVETPTTACGNANLETGEQCDDGNLKSGDGCSITCQTEVLNNQSTTTTTTTSTCGNSVCSSSENCSTCPSDCGVCTSTLKSNGQSCTTGTQCLSGSCVDSVCCNTACSEICKSCNVAGSVGTCSTTPSALPTNGLISYYPFDNDASDSAGGNDGSVSGATWTSDGKIGGAYSFDGVDDFINLGSTAIINKTITYTILAWIKTTNDGTIYSEQGYGTNSVTLYFGSNTFQVGSIGWKITPWVGNVKDGNWHFLVAIFSTDNGHKLYLDGNLDNENTNTDTPPFTSNPRIGAFHAGDLGTPVSFFNGIIDEVAIYNRALSASEIQQLYQREC